MIISSQQINTSNIYASYLITDCHGYIMRILLTNYVLLLVFFETKIFSTTTHVGQVCYGIVYPYLQYTVLTWCYTARKYLKRIRILQIKIVKTIFKSNKLKVKILPLYNHLKLLKLDKIYNLKVTNLCMK